MLLVSFFLDLTYPSLTGKQVYTVYLILSARYGAGRYQTVELIIIISERIDAMSVRFSSFLILCKQNIHFSFFT